MTEPQHSPLTWLRETPTLRAPMCGIAGLFSADLRSADALRSATERMIAPIVHRGPDDSGIWVAPEAGAALGFRRLSIIDLSPFGHQPMASASGRFTMVYNGEVYNFPELRRELEGRGAAFRGHSDTEVMLAAFEQWGIRRALERSMGMYGLAVWDAQTRSLTLARDRLGKKPVYLYHEPGILTFGSELKSLVAGPRFDRTIDRTALTQYLRYLYVPAPRSMYRSVKKLLPGHLITISDPSAALPASEPYWSLDEVARAGLRDPFTGNDDEAVEALDALLGDAVRRRMVADVPLGALLSGGVDSSAIVALMQEASNRPVRTYSIGFREAEFDEAPHARAVAKHLGTEHTELILTGRDALALVPRLPTMFDEPLADASQLPTYLISQMARRDVTVALVGDGGDEMFAGYNRYSYGLRTLPAAARWPGAIRRLAAAGLSMLGPGTWDRLYGLAAAVLPRSRRERLAGEKVHRLANLLKARDPGQMYRTIVSHWQHPEHVVNEDGTNEDEVYGAFAADRSMALLDRMMLSDQRTYLPDDLLAKVDRASMAVSLEVRAPILDHRVVELSWRMPHRMKLRGGVTKWILREVLYRRVPRSLIDRPKMGFSVPIDEWLRGPLRTWGEDLMATTPSLPIIRSQFAQRAWRDMLAGRGQAGTGLWALLLFLDWQAHWRAA